MSILKSNNAGFLYFLEDTMSKRGYYHTTEDIWYPYLPNAKYQNELDYHITKKQDHYEVSIEVKDALFEVVINSIAVLDTLEKYWEQGYARATTKNINKYWLLGLKVLNLSKNNGHY